MFGLKDGVVSLRTLGGQGVPPRAVRLVTPPGMSSHVPKVTLLFEDKLRCVNKLKPLFCPPVETC